MANRLRGAGTLWSNASVGINGTSAGANVDSDSTVTVFINNSGGSSTTITVQASGENPPGPGMNGLPNATWYDYIGADAITVPAGSKVCFDLSPFGPQYLRLKSSTATTLDAWVTCIG